MDGKLDCVGYVFQQKEYSPSSGQIDMRRSAFPVLVLFAVLSVSCVYAIPWPIDLTYRLIKSHYFPDCRDAALCPRTLFTNENPDGIDTAYLIKDWLPDLASNKKTMFYIQLHPGSGALEREAVENLLGTSLSDYLPHHTFVAYASPKLIDIARMSMYVNWIGPIAPINKLSTGLFKVSQDYQSVLSELL